MATTMDGERLKAIRVSGSKFTGELEQLTTGVSFSMALDKVTSMTLGFADDYNLSLFRSRLMDKGASISYGEWNLTIDKVDLGSNDAGPHLTVDAMSTFVYKWEDQFGAKTWTDADVTQWFRDRCSEVGAEAVVQPGLGRRTIVRESSLEGGFQNTWEVMAQVKRETGVWMFERGRSFIVGRPSWIISQHGIFQEWPFMWNDWYDYSPGLAGLPVYTGRNGKTNQETLQLSLVSEDADTIRPGDRVYMNGYSVGHFGGTWIVSDVGYPMTNANPVTVDCIRPVDPPKEESTTLTGLGSTEGAGVANTTTGVGNTKLDMSNLPSAVAGFTGQQLINAAHIIRAAQALNLPKRAAQIGVMTAIGESTLRVLNVGTIAHPDARGIFQQPETGWGTYPERMDPHLSALAFFAKLRNVPGWVALEPSAAAHAVQGNAEQFYYRPFWSSAVAVVDAIIATASDAGGVSIGGELPPALAAAVDRYVNSVIGRPIDVDKMHGAQCADLTMHYTLAMGGPRIWANGRDWWATGRTSGFYVGVSANSAARKGDVACWGAAGYGGGWGHVAIVLADLGATLRVLTQNPGAPKIMTLSKNNLDGYLRPKNWK